MFKIYENYSKINGKVEVTKDPFFGASIKCDGLTQSGDLIEKIWQKPLKKLSSPKGQASLISNYQYSNVLILGLGGGSTAKLIRKYWPEAKITGVDLDPIMIDLGKKYLKLDDYKVDIKIADAYEFVTNHQSLTTNNYDLILIDLYQGREVPQQFDTEEFAKMIKKILSPEGTAVFNRLYAAGTRPKAVKFMHKLEKVFSEVDPIYPMANVMFITKK